MNSKELKILHLEDYEADAIIIRERLREDGLIFQIEHVSTEREFTNKLSSEKHDIILSDYSMPGFSGIAALLLSKKICPEVPFICISGTIGEDMAVELIHLGATDYIIKDNLSKLSTSINRALKEAKERETRIRAELLLKESEARFRDIIVSSNDWIWEIDKNSKYSYSSEKIEKILGYSKDEFIGKTPFDFMPDDEIEAVGSTFSEIAGAKGVIKDLENWNLHKDGHRVCLLTNGFPIVDEAGELIGYRGVDKDITDRKLAEEKIRKLSRATEQSPVSVLITDLHGKITYANPAVTRLTGYSLEKLIGKNPSVFSSGETTKEDYNILWETIKSGKDWKGEFHNKKKSGELYWESASISPILNEKGEMTHFLAIKEDITERKRLTNDLIEAKIRAEASDKLKTAFLNNISHEVRTPLNGILGFSEFVIQPGLLQEEKENFLKILKESSERLLNTITNYMDISLIVSGNMLVKSKPIDLQLVLDKVYRKFLPKCKSKNLDFVKQFNTVSFTHFISDDGLIEKAFSHLLDNAIKFTDDGSIIIGFNKNDSEFEFFVKDTGSGIDHAAQDSVFKIFVQEDAAYTKGYDGSGLGLSITKGLVELLGGRIRLESVKGEGAAFFITLPQSPLPQSAFEIPQSAISSASKPVSDPRFSI